MFVRIYTDSDGQSHFEDLTVAMGQPGRSPMQAAVGISFNRAEPGHFMDWHNAPRRQYVIILAGLFEITIGDGTKRRMGPGDVLLAEDLTGKGHTTRTVGNETRLSATIPLA